MIHAKVPVGRMINKALDAHVTSSSLFDYDSEVINNANKKMGKHQLGSCGGGNHFVEIQKRDDGRLNLMVHTGSRNLGQMVRLAYQRKAEKELKSERLISLQAESKDGQSYLRDADFAVRFARENRREILRRCYESFQEKFPQKVVENFEDAVNQLIDLPHNFISIESHFGQQVYVHRKGAIHLAKGELGVIPSSMGTFSYIVEGRGNQYSFDSCSHGAGRLMSRGEAMALIKREDFLEAVQAVVCNRSESMLEEAPQAYKNIDQVMMYQQSLAKRVHRLSPLVSIKG
jgi:tRNA-splicing ligase RtcB